MPRIRAFLFDMDGLLIDTEDLHMRAFATTATRLGFPSQPLDFTNWIGHSSLDMADWLATRCTAGIAAAEILRQEQEEYLRVLHAERPLPLPGVREMIEYCDERPFARGLVSSTIYAQVVKTMAVVLAHLGRADTLEETFHAVATGDRVPRLKPHPDPYLQVARELGLAPEECLVFEDSPAGVASGRAAGCRVVAIPNLYLPAEDVAREAHASFPTLQAAFHARVWET